MIKICLLALDSGENDEKCPNCGITLEKIYSLSARIMSNILLNNYTKMYNNKIVEICNRKKRMKLSTIDK